MLTFRSLLAVLVLGVSMSAALAQPVTIIGPTPAQAPGPIAAERPWFPEGPYATRVRARLRARHWEKKGQEVRIDKERGAWFIYHH